MLPERKEIVRIVRYLPKEKLFRLLKYAEELEDELTPEEIAAIKEGEAQIARGETISLDELRRRYDL